MRTKLCELLGIDVPIISAPMGRQAGPLLTAAASNAGGLGTSAVWLFEIDELRRRIREIRSLTTRPFAINLNLNFPQEQRLSAALSENVPIVSFFWGDPAGMVEQVKLAGAKVIQTVGSAAEARLAVSRGADVIVAQGWEAGGHVWSSVATMALVPAVVDAVAPVPVVAAGGICDGRGLAAALALGASGVWMGTRFLAATEADVHPYYQQRLIEAAESDTVHLDNLFDIGWPEAPHRVLRNSTVAAWEAAGRPPIGNRPGEGETVAYTETNEPIIRYEVRAPLRQTKGELEALPLWAGQGVAAVKSIQPAADIMRDVVAEAESILRELALRSIP